MELEPPPASATPFPQGFTKEGVKSEFLSSFADPSAHTAWREVGMQKGLCNDEEIACFLLKYYEDTRPVLPWGSPTCLICGSSLSLTCPPCERNINTANKGAEDVDTKEEKEDSDEESDDSDDDDDGGGGEPTQPFSEHSHISPVGKTPEATQNIKNLGNSRTEVPITPLPLPASSMLTSPSPSAGLPQRYLPLMREDARRNEKPVYVNAKQYNRILKRREARKRLEASGKVLKERQVLVRYKF
ncbi:hypothetical protein ACOMHN_041432 [Nucella lapillus]